MASFSEFVRFCLTRTGCDKGGLYAIQPRGLRGSPIKIGAYPIGNTIPELEERVLK